MEKPWEFDDFIFDGDVLKGMTRKGKDKIKNEELFDMVVPAEGPDGTKIRVIGEQCFFRRKLNSVVIHQIRNSTKFVSYRDIKEKYNRYLYSEKYSPLCNK